MNHFLETFQKVVDVGREDPTEGLQVTASGTGSSGAMELANLPNDVDKLKKLLVAKQHAFDVLYEESVELQGKLTKVTHRLTLQRDLWLTSLECQENIIQALVEAAVRASADSAGDGASAPASPIEEGGVYLNSLLEQIEMLKASLTKLTSEKEAVQVALEQELRRQAAQLPHHQSVADDVAEEHQSALRKLNGLWDQERLNYEAKLEEMTMTLKLNTENMELLAQKHNEILDSFAIAKRSFMESASAQHENEESQPEHEQHPGDPIPLIHSPLLPSVMASEWPTPSETPRRAASAAAEKDAATAPTAGHPAGEDEVPHQEGNAAAAAECVALRAQVERLKREVEEVRQECRAREDALAAMYDDNKRLEEGNSHLRAELAIYKEEAQRSTTDSGSVQRLLLEETERSSSLKAALESARQQQGQLQKEVTILQAKVKTLEAGGVSVAGPALGSVIPSGKPTFANASGDTGANSAHSRARDFVKSASAKLSAAKRDSTSTWMHAHMRIVVAFVLALTVMTFFSLTFGGYGPTRDYDSVATEEALRSQLHNCLLMLHKRGVHL